MSDLTMQELREVQTDLDQIREDFADLEEVFGKQAFGFGVDDGASDTLDPLDVALEQSGLMDDDTQSAGQLSIMALADGEISEQSLSIQGWNPWLVIPNKTKKNQRKIVSLVKRYAKYSKCVPAVTKAVALFKAKKTVRH